MKQSNKIIQIPSCTTEPIALTQNELYTNLILSPIGEQLEDTSKPSILLVTKLLRSTIVCVLEKDVRLALNALRLALKLRNEFWKVVN
jgi:hypothetical protein